MNTFQRDKADEERRGGVAEHKLHNVVVGDNMDHRQFVAGEVGEHPIERNVAEVRHIPLEGLQLGRLAEAVCVEVLNEDVQLVRCVEDGKQSTPPVFAAAEVLEA